MKKPFAVIGFSMMFATTMTVFTSKAATLVMSVVSALCFLVLLIIYKRRLFEKYPLWSVSLITVALTFVLTAVIRQAPFKTVEKFSGETAVIQGEIQDYPTKSYGKYYYTVKVESLENGDGIESVKPFKIKMSSAVPITAVPYDKIKGEVTFYRFTNEFGFNSESRNWADGIILGAYTSYGEMEAAPADKRPLNYYFKQARHELVKGIRVMLPAEEAGLLNAMLLGDMDGMGEEMSAAFRNSGITHLIVISGMHMVMISGLLQWILGLLRVPRKLRPPISIAGVLLFMLLVGMEPSVLRSGITIIIVLLSDMLGRDSEKVNSLGFAAALMCLINPMIGGDIGFLLSVFATLGICVIYPQMEEKLKEKCSKIPKAGKIVFTLLSAFLLSVSANILILPLQVFVFREFTFAGIIATVLLTIPSTILVYAGIVISLLYLPVFTAVLAAPFQMTAIWCCDIIYRTAQQFSKLSYLRIRFNGGSGMMVLICGLCLFTLVFALGKTKRKTIFASAVCAVFIAAGAATDYLKNRDMLTVAVIDQGEDSCVVLMKNEEASIIALNGFRTYAAAEQLRINGIKRLRNIILTDDGYEGIKAAAEVFKMYQPEDIWAVPGFYPGKSLSPYLENYSTIDGTERLELVTGVMGELEENGGILFALTDGTKFFAGNYSERVDEADIIITANPSYPQKTKLVILQTEDIENLTDIIEQSGNYMLVRENGAIYIDVPKDKEIIIRREY